MDKVKVGKISEIFKSIQGEGIYAGRIEQVFVRLFGCNLRCKFCDTPDNSFMEYTADSIFKRVISLNKSNNIHSVSITGGEPLLQISFLEYLCNLLKKNKFKIYLETNGVMHNNLKQIIKLIDCVSMDFKLPSSTGLPSFWVQHLEFLKIAHKKEVFVKVVVTSNTKLNDVKKSAEIIAKVNKNIPLILQPVSVNSSGMLADPSDVHRGYQIRGQFPSTLQILKSLKISREYLSDVRIIPQIHKLLGVR